MPTESTENPPGEGKSVEAPGAGLVEGKTVKGSNRVKVNIRCRPILPSDNTQTSTNDLSSSTLAERAVDINEPEGQVIVALDKTFKFDSAFDGDAGQDAVYRSGVAPLVQHFIFDCNNAR